MVHSIQKRIVIVLMIAGPANMRTIAAASLKPLSAEEYEWLAHLKNLIDTNVTYGLVTQVDPYFLTNHKLRHDLQRLLQLFTETTYVNRYQDGSNHHCKIRWNSRNLFFLSCPTHALPRQKIQSDILQQLYSAAKSLDMETEVGKNIKNYLTQCCIRQLQPLQQEEKASTQYRHLNSKLGIRTSKLTALVLIAAFAWWHRDVVIRRAKEFNWFMHRLKP